MPIHEFCIIASGLDPQAEDFERRFYDAGCDDATISFQGGRIIVDFSREAACRTAAVQAGIRDVQRTGATVERVGSL